MFFINLYKQNKMKQSSYFLNIATEFDSSELDKAVEFYNNVPETKHIGAQEMKLVEKKIMPNPKQSNLYAVVAVYCNADGTDKCSKN